MAAVLLLIGSGLEEPELVKELRLGTHQLAVFPASIGKNMEIISGFFGERNGTTKASFWSGPNFANPIFIYFPYSVSFPWKPVGPYPSISSISHPLVLMIHSFLF